MHYNDKERLDMFTRHVAGALDDYGDLWTVKVNKSGQISLTYNSGNKITLTIKQEARDEKN